MSKSNKGDIAYPVYTRGDKTYMPCANSVSRSKYYNGRICSNLVEVRDRDVRSVLCWRCLAEKIPMPKDEHSNHRHGYPRGWAFMTEFVDADGNVFHRGVEQPQLKGSLPPTVVKIRTKKKESKSENGELYLEMSSIKLQLKRETDKKKRVELTKRLDQLHKLTTKGKTNAKQR